jgi:hypothetical protein
VQEPLADDELAGAVRIDTDLTPDRLAGRCAEMAQAWAAAGAP